MRHILPLVLLASTSAFAQIPSASDHAAIMTAENLFWTNYVSGDTSELSKQLLPDFQNVEQEIWSRDQVLKFDGFFIRTAHCTLAPVKIEDPHIVMLDSTTATIVYHAVETVTCGGKTMGGTTNISTVWRFIDQRWQMQLHTEYAVPADFKPSGF